MATIQDLGKVAYFNKGMYNSETNYEINDVVSYNGSSYVSLLNNNQGNLPTNATYWSVVALKGEKGDPGDLDSTAIVDNLTTNRADKVLSAKQGKVLKDLVDANKIVSDHGIINLNSALNLKANTADVASEYATKESVNDNISSLDAKVNSLASGSPLVASSISDMTDTTRSYVLVTDGHWYWYDGTAWQDGGIYQSTGISDNSINILMLKDNIQSNFNKEYSENLLTASAQGATNGYYKIDALTNKAVFISNSLYTNYDVDLNVGDIYAFTGYNVYELKGLIICDGNDNVIYSPASGTTHIREQYNVSAIFNVKDIGLHAYVSIYNNFTPYNEIVNLRKVTNIYNNLKIASNELEPIFTLNNCYIAYDNTHNNNVISLSQNSSYNVTCYPVASGLTYKVKYKGYYNVRGACLTSLSNGLIWIDDSVDEETYEFTAEQDGYLYLCNLSPFVKGSVELVYKAININGENILKNKKIIYDGDSICESRLGASANNGGGYAYQIAQNTGGTYVNQAVGGGTLSYISAQTAHSVVNNLENLPTDGDIYCFEGGVNDWWGNRELGTFSKTDYTGDLDVSTISGALETIFRYAINNFQGKPIVFVIIHKVNQPYSVFRAGTFEDVRARFIEICEKYAIPYFDAWKDSGLNGIITSQMNAYLNANATGTPDGTHPNANGYKYFYTPQLTALFESVISRT